LRSLTLFAEGSFQGAIFKGADKTTAYFLAHCFELQLLNRFIQAPILDGTEKRVLHLTTSVVHFLLVLLLFFLALDLLDR
jgi:hypothetical protein